MVQRRRRRSEAWRVWSAAPLVLALALGACESAFEPGPELGYEFSLPAETETVYRWTTGSTIRVHVTGGVGERGELLTDAFEEAARDWETALGEGQVRFQREATVEASDVVLRWSDVVSPVETDGCEPRVTGRATTTFCWTPDRRRVKAYLPRGGGSDLRIVGTPLEGVRMIVTVHSDEARELPRVRQLVAHELGHVLGIGRHSFDPADLMWGGTLDATRPTPADRATVRRLYETVPDVVL